MYEIFEIKKKVTCFFPLNPVTFCGENFQKQKCLELVTSPLSCITCLQKFLFWSYPLNLEAVDQEKRNLVFSFAHSDILWRKFSKAKMPGTSYQSLELHNMLTKIPFLVLPFKSGSCGKRKTKNDKD